jgi:hypothetical protein
MIDASTKTFRAVPGRGRSPHRQSDWRNYANSAERLDLEAIENHAQHLDRKRQALSFALLTIRNRCMQRRRLAQLRKAAAE